MYTISLQHKENIYMLISKNGISRQIDDKRFGEYKDKGYKAVDTTKSKAKPATKPVKE